eukprot:gene9484-12775_t
MLKLTRFQSLVIFGTTVTFVVHPNEMKKIVSRRGNDFRSHCNEEDSDSNKPIFAKPLVYVIGSAGLDYITQIPFYPKPDEKIRATHLEIVGGGNAANTSTALSRLGVPVKLFTKIGDDNNSQVIINEMKKEINLDTNYILLGKKCLSPVTFVLVDRVTSTRTCVHHTKVDELTPDESKDLFKHSINSNEEKPFLLHSDSRQTIGAIAMAKLAVAQNIPVSIDIEKFRPNVENLIPLCSIIFTNQHFPRIFYDNSNMEHKSKSSDESITFNSLDEHEREGLFLGMKALLNQGKARVVISTLGSNGSVLMMRNNEDLLSSLNIDYDKSPIILDDLLSESLSTTIITDDEYTIIKCSAWPIDKQDIIDTTGAGDAFIGGFIAGVSYGLLPEDCLRLGTLVAAQKLKGVGSRSTLPDVTAINKLLLSLEQ